MLMRQRFSCDALWLVTTEMWSEDALLVSYSKSGDATTFRWLALVESARPSSSRQSREASSSLCYSLLSPSFLAVSSFLASSEYPSSKCIHFSSCYFYLYLVATFVHSYLVDIK